MKILWLLVTLFFSTLTFAQCPPAPATVVFNGTDMTTQGAWNGVYGHDGHIIPDTEASDGNNPFPTYVTFGPKCLGSSTPGYDGSHPYATHAYTNLVQGIPSLMGTEDKNPTSTNLMYLCNYTYFNAAAPWAPQSGIGTNSREISMWYACGANTFWLEFNYASPHNFELYAVDDPNGSTRRRSEQIQVLDAASGAVLYDSGSFTNFTGGVYYRWTINGHVKIRIIDTAGTGYWFGACVNAVFFDPPSIPLVVPKPPTNLRIDNVQ